MWVGRQHLSGPVYLKPIVIIIIVVVVIVVVIAFVFVVLVRFS